MTDIVLIVEDKKKNSNNNHASDDDDDDDSYTEKVETETFVFGQSQQEEAEPLRVDSAVAALDKPKHHSCCDDPTDETCEVSSRSSSDKGDQEATGTSQWIHDLMWLTICFAGIMFSFVLYGIMLEYTTSGDRHLHERTCYCEIEKNIMQNIFFAVNSPFLLFAHLCN